MKRNAIIITAIFTVICGMALAAVSVAAEEKPAFVEPRAVVRMLDNREKIVFINVASFLECMDSRIPSSLCIECGEAREKLRLLPQDQNVRIVFYDGNATAPPECELLPAVRARGFKRIYLLKGGLTAWKRAGYETETVDRTPRARGLAVKPEKLKSWLAANPAALLVDLRRPADFKSGSIPGAVNMPLSSLHETYQDLYWDRPLLLIDQDGSRSFLAAGYLNRKGLENVRRLEGGMAAWQAWSKRRKP